MVPEPADTESQADSNRPSTKSSNSWIEWSINKLGSRRDAVSTNTDYFLRVAPFTTGQYDLAVTALYWTDKDSAAKTESAYDSVTAHTNVTIVAPQWVVILGAILRGLAAYWLLPKIRMQKVKEDIQARGIVSGALLSSIVTILLSMISDTQFFVRVTVNDLWGAIAIGFIAAATGTSYLRRLVEDDMAAEQRDQQQGQSAQVTTAPSGTVPPSTAPATD